MKLRKSPRAALVGCLLSGTAMTSAFAQDIALDEIVVTASGFEQNVADAPASISVITAEELEKGNFSNLSDALREVQGVVTTGIAAEKDIQIRGLPGQYTLILVDGKRQGTRDARPNGSSGYEQSFIPPLSAIERIEVVRGPMSSLYGSDAMGGVVNIITKKVGDVWGGSVTAEGTVNEHSKYGNDQQLSFYLNGPIVADRLGLQLWGRGYNREGTSVEDGANGSQEYDLTGRLTFTPDANNDIMLEMGTSQIEARPYDATSYTDHDRDHWSLSHVGRYGSAQTDLSFSQEKGQRTSYSREGVTEGYLKSDRAPEITNSTLDGKVTLPFTLAGEHTATLGGQYIEAELKDQNPGTGSTATETFSVDQWSVFAEDEWQITDTFALTGGLRHTEHEQFGGHLTPRIYGVWSATDTLTVKGGISTGYRTPELRQTVDGYYYTTQRGAGVIVSNPDLKPEESLSYELAALWDNGPLNLSGTIFRTEFKDKIESFNTGETIIVEGTSYNRWEYRNVQEALIQGIELTADYEISPSLDVRGTYTYTKSEQESGEFEGFPLARTPEHMASLRLDWMTPVEGLDMWGTVNYHGSETNAGARIGTNGTPVVINGVTGYKYDAYTTVDVGGGYQLTDAVKVNAAVYNLFDKELTSEDNNVVGEGRKLWLGLTTTF